VEANITERLTNINADKVELLQFHWQDVFRRILRDFGVKLTSLSTMILSM